MREIKDWKDGVTAGFVSVFFIGYVPFAPGTLGSIPAAALLILVGAGPTALLSLTAIVFACGWPAATRAERIFGRKDPSEVVIDEFVGMLAALLWLPATWKSVAVVFLLFRLFDILKPFPANKCENLKGGLGIMADDLVAALYANLTYRIITLLF